MLRCPGKFAMAALATAACATVMAQGKPPQKAAISNSLIKRAAPLKDHCFDRAALLQRVDVRLLKAIGMVESAFSPSAVNRNINGSEDMGVMQINSIWLPQLSKLLGITRETLMIDPCTNIHVGACGCWHKTSGAWALHGMPWGPTTPQRHPSGKSMWPRSGCLRRPAPSRPSNRPADAHAATSVPGRQREARPRLI